MNVIMQPSRLSIILLTGILSACGGSEGSEENFKQPTESVVESSPAVSSALPSDLEMAKILMEKQESNSSGVSGGKYFLNSSGIALTYSTTGLIDKSNPFFKAFGNGRSCDTCHKMAEGWTITPLALKARFLLSEGKDPIFNPVDGANSPLAPTQTLSQKKAAYSMLLDKGLIRIGLPVPATAEFVLLQAEDPYQFANASELSLFRRPLPSANLSFLSAVMWDGRETARDATSSNCIRGTTTCFAPIDLDLRNQAVTAVKGHAQAAQGLTVEEQRSVVDFESALFSAQIFDIDAWTLNVQGAKGGPEELRKDVFYFGINDLQTGDYKTNAPFNPNVMTMYSGWSSFALPSNAVFSRDKGRAAIVRGQDLFNNRVINIAGTKGINDALNQPLFMGTCSTCHNVPNSGNRSVPLPIDIGTSDASRRTPDLPLYTLQNKATGQTIQTTDPGRALVTGKWADIGKFKIPSLRGLASRAPYFHNGSAKNLEETVNFYNTRFGMGLTAQETADLVAFMKAL